jgi:hypothetical protein
MHQFRALLIAVTVFLGGSRSDAGLIITLVDNGGTAPTTTGTGTLTTVMEAAASVWELAFSSTSFTHSLLLEYRWADIGTGGVLAFHQLLAQSGTPNREDYGMLDFDGDGSSSFFLDGTLDTDSLADLIASSSEYSTFTSTSSDYGGGSINHQRSFSGASGDAFGQTDLFTVALHEIGHALGMSSANFSYQGESWPDNDIDVTGSMPFAGSVFGTTNTGTNPPGGPGFVSNAHLSVGSTLLFPSLSTSVRKLPTAVDILANAQLSQFTNPNLDLAAVAAVPEPSSLLLASIIGGCGFAARVRRRRLEKVASA